MVKKNILLILGLVVLINLGLFFHFRFQKQTKSTLITSG